MCGIEGLIFLLKGISCTVLSFSVFVYIYIYIYIYNMCVYIYTYIYMHKAYYSYGNVFRCKLRIVSLDRQFSV